ncbi:LOW QUALITY PROTEIN: uncharacterized protein EMH_0008950 [Eimeria mitis]|uniref:Protein kinase domain-containing protein n=1 Tax=Eimeria mitis TaxID=44415 RepID=U6K526_9EIME|nr:LOW QUALITY PROTEIN: uncharacterized protein EMH_0008950 [Eimeria mitis]CDJ31412.1 hypothetical protein, conserved [Eimeria mitis]
MDGYLPPGETTNTTVKSEPSLAAKRLPADSHKKSSISSLGRVGLVSFTLAAASLLLFFSIHKKLAPRLAPIASISPVDSVESGGSVHSGDSEDLEAASILATTSPSLLAFDEQEKPPPQQLSIDADAASPPPGESSTPHTQPSGEVEPSESSAFVVSTTPPVKYVSQRDVWGLDTLEQFELNLPASLQQGKAALAAWGSEFYESDEFFQNLDAFQRSVSEAIWEKAVNSFVDTVVVLRGTRPLRLDEEIKHLPHVLRVTKVATVLQGGLLLHVEDVFGVEKFLGKVRRAFNDERNTEIQACGQVSAELAANEKGFAVSRFTGEIAGAVPVCYTEGTYIMNRPKLMEKVKGTLMHLKKRAPGVMKEARDYIAFRLLQIVLKLEQAGIGHLGLDWDSLFLREDGSFLLGNFGSSAPFGRPVVSQLAYLSHQVDPGILTRAEGSVLYPAPGGNLWSLGLMLFQLYTGKDDPYGKAQGRSEIDAATNLARGLLSRDTRSYVLSYELTACNVPSRWKQLIMRLLEPRAANRINGFEVTMEFPDLVHPSGN